MRPEKQILVEQIKTVMGEDGSFFLISFMGLSVAKQEAFKAELREQSSVLQVHKNSLIKQAAKAKEINELAELELKGGTAIVAGTAEIGDIAKVIKNFSKDNEEVQFKAAYVDGQFLDAKDALACAGLPTKDEARAKLLATLNAAPQQLASVLNNSAASILNVLNAYQSKLEK